MRVLTPAAPRCPQFETLRTQLMSDDKHREIVQTIDFPPQRWFGKLKQSTVDERVKGLGTWLSVRSSPAPPTAAPCASLRLRAACGWCRKFAPPQRCWDPLSWPSFSGARDQPPRAGVEVGAHSASYVVAKGCIDLIFHDRLLVHPE